MGVPAFFRWLSKKYPQIIVHCVEEKGHKDEDGNEIPINATKPNPNDVEFDNLYLDMNGIIHPCCHPEGRPAPADEDEMMAAIFEHIDRLFAIVRPRRVLYMAIDGVAPRAKMNQQRSRRFRAIKENVDRQNEIEKVRSALVEQGLPVPPKKTGGHFDSNCITPGTPFMARLAECLRYYIHNRLNSDPAWKNIQVILSDANAPGEGEHKIMDYIRKQRASPGHDPNTQHVLCGADADLIMLGLATHEPNFTIIREEFRPGPRQTPCALCGQFGHELKDCQGVAKDEEAADQPPDTSPSEQAFIFVRLCVLREYLAKDLMMDFIDWYDFERALDDWVFMCFFVGNDFLPHLPSLEIREGAIDRLIRLYKETIARTGGWLTDQGTPHMQRTQMILTKLGEVEDETFKKRYDNELRFRERRKHQDRQAKEERLRAQQQSHVLGGSMGPMTPDQHRSGGRFGRGGHGARQEMASQRTTVSNFGAAAEMKAMMKGGNKRSNDNTPDSSGAKFARSGSGSRTSLNSSYGSAYGGRTAGEDSEEEPEPYDEVELHKSGWKERYYQSKFEVSTDDLEFRRTVGRAYAEGLCWVLRYYYQGCASWKWFFPYHYAPFASDFVHLSDIEFDFPVDTKPFNPLEQLMGVFPAGSRQHIPPAWQSLLLDTESPIIDFYPENFQIDLNGKKFDWQGVALLPFVEEGRLLEALADRYDQLTEEEVERNKRGPDRLFVSVHHPMHKFLTTVCEEADESKHVPIDNTLCNGMSGVVTFERKSMVPLGSTVVSPLPPVWHTQVPDVHDCQSVALKYEDPIFEADYAYSAKRLEGAETPDAVLKAGDFNRQQRFQSGGQYQHGQTGFRGRRDRANVSDSGHRQMNFQLNRNAQSEGNFRQNGGGYGSGGGGGHRGGGGGYGRGGGGGGGFAVPQQVWQQQQPPQHSAGYNQGQQQQQSWGQPPQYMRGGGGGGQSAYRDQLEEQNRNYHQQQNNRAYGRGGGNRNGGNQPRCGAQNFF